MMGLVSGQPALFRRVVVLYHNNKKWPNQSRLGHCDICYKILRKLGKQGGYKPFYALTMTNLKALVDGFFDIKIKADGLWRDIDNIVALA